MVCNVCNDMQSQNINCITHLLHDITRHNIAGVSLMLSARVQA
jgi:hypothetical protein